MTGNSFGEIFRITNWGESHGKALGVVVDGCPPLLELDEKDIQKDLDRRRPGQSGITTPRDEKDQVEILSGVFDGRTTGTPISLIIHNKDFRKEDYQEMATSFRPSHADFTYLKKYGIRDPYGGGRSSARITAGNVAAGAIARKILKKQGVEIIAYVKKIKNVEASVNVENVTTEDVERNIVRCPDVEKAQIMVDLIKETKEQGDSLGGVVECVVRNLPPGLGEPIFDKLEADLAKAMLSINASKGFEIGSGFKGAELKGSEHNDAFVIKESKMATETNNSGGIQGGISNGMPIIFRVAFKPTSTIRKIQRTVNSDNEEVMLEAKGRHDPCVLPRAVPIVETMAALILCDHYLRNHKLSMNKHQ